MRLLLELVLAAALVAAGWNTPFSELIGQAGHRAPRPAGVGAKSGAKGAGNGAWMWSHEGRASLDRRTDAQGRTYRVDRDGKRHYDN